MKKIIISSLAASLLLFSYSCDTDFENDVNDVAVTSGSADFSKYVALGNSLTSGYRDNALYIDGQNESYPAIIAAQMKLAGGGEFKQPLMANNIGGFTNLFNPATGAFAGKYVLSVVNGSLSPAPTAPGGALDIITAGGPYQNMGIPGAKSFHLGAAGYGNAAGLSAGLSNPYFVRFASSGTTSVIQDAAAQAPTFFSLWIGNNDVLSYATSGGMGTDQTGNMNPATYGSNDITDPGVFASVINSYVTALTANGAKGVIANIPNVTTIPYFTRVPAKPLAGLSATQTAQLNGGYAQYNAGLLQAKNLGAINDAEYQSRLISFTTTGSNGAIIVDKDLTNLTGFGIPSYRQTTSEDLILLTASAVLNPTVGGGTSVPLEDRFVLTKKETAKAIAATTAYNAALKSIADSKGLAFVDANAKMAQLAQQSGISFNGVKYTATFVTGGTFSLDGVHLTGRGAALIGNEFIKAINNKFGSNLPMANVNSYSGVTFP
ncbi:G-D-S-L family lipolytic protein [Chryseobacterium sp. cx-311]|uniref:G-D-S-L family lipolytic protein n=1 Tax=Marnyiella aurantia TaxID=2758037 RepID=UPI001AE2BCCE|nr:G-D-S-L family lipolytic protein [Marnyiella aurantia]MBP0613825.1 G-D-S-L family lipolytic protein [Marnyiella aurantia]